MSEARNAARNAARNEAGNRRGPAPGRTIHRGRSDIAGDVLAVARAPGSAAPREIRIRRELLERLLAQVDGDIRAAVQARAELAGIPLVVDPELPDAPGFEVVRARPGGTARPHAAAA